MTMSAACWTGLAGLSVLLLASCAPGTTAAGSSASSSSGNAASVTITTITPDQAIAPVAFTRLPGGDFVVVEGAAYRLVELDETGHVVHVNATDFGGLAWPNEVISDDDGAVYVAAEYSVFRYAFRTSGPRTAWYPRNGNDTVSALAYGGTPRRIWAIEADNPTAPMVRLVRYDNATADGPGTPTVITTFARAGYRLAISDDNTVFMSDSNACRIVKVQVDGSLSVVVGTELGTTGVCANGGDIPRAMSRVGQGQGLGFTPDGSKLVFSDGSTHALIDVTPGADGKSQANSALVTFEAGVNNEMFVTTEDALFVLDVANKAFKKVEL